MCAKASTWSVLPNLADKALCDLAPVYFASLAFPTPQLETETLHNMHTELSPNTQYLIATWLCTSLPSTPLYFLT